MNYNPKHQSILLLDADFVQAYSVARSLKESGFRVIIAASTRMSYGFLSRYPSKRLLSPDSKKHKDYIHFLEEAVKNHPINVMIPLTNDTAEILSEFYEKFEAMGVKVAQMPWNAFIKAHDKEKLMELCEQISVPHPRTRHLDINTLDDDAQYIGFPALIKPNVSVGARGIVKVDDVEQLRKTAAQSLADYGSCTLQQFINNEERYFNAILFRNKKGEICAHTILEITRFFPVNGGSSCFCTTVENPQLVEICTRVLDELQWVGIADFDVLLDKNEGFKIIEINPRIPASIHAAYNAGVNFPEIMVKDLLGQEIISPYYKPGNQLRFLLMDAMWFLSSPKRFKARPSWFKFFGRRLCYQDLSIHDPFIFLAGLMNGLSKLLSPSYRKAKLKSQ